MTVSEDDKPDPSENEGPNGQEARQEVANTAGAVSETGNAATGAYSQRELHFVSREAAGALAFKYVVNDGTPQNLIWLTALKNIFSKQLPNMPREYIARLVFERRHRSVAIVTADGTVTGGITYRTFPGGDTRTLGEIAFCAVSSTHQVKGFGTRLMNWTKEHARTRDGLSHFLTYADNNAVGYFAKQGFTKEVSLPRERWAGAIKDYDGGTLMEFVIHPRVNYAALPAMVAAQRSALESRLKTISNSHVVHPPLCAPGAEFVPLPPHEVPGVTAAGYKGPPEPPYRLTLGGAIVPATPEARAAFMDALLAALRAHDAAWPFLEPVDAAAVPDYAAIVSDPMDLSTIGARLASGRFYITLDIFLADLRRIWANARLYNREDTVYYRQANQLEEFVDEYLMSHVHPLPAA